jgi:hypothetical protein
VQGIANYDDDINPANNERTLPYTVLLARATGLAIAPGAFRALAGGPSVRPAAVKKAGAKVSFRLNFASPVLFTVERAKLVPGRTVDSSAGKVCDAITPSNRSKPPCKRPVVLKGSFDVNGKAGANRFRFTGRLAKRALKPGRYRLVATTADGAVARAPFTIKR